MNPLEDHAVALLKRDPLDEAEKTLGVGNEAVSLSIGLLQDIQRMKADVFSILDDTHFRISHSEYIDMLHRRNFQRLYIEMHGQMKDMYSIWWHPDGVLLTLESYERRYVNAAQAYYNWIPKSKEAAYGILASGGYVGPNIWSGYSDAREGLFTHLKQLHENGQLLSQWVEAPFLWLVNYSESREQRIDRDAINGRKFALLPDYVRAAVGPIAK